MARRAKQEERQEIGDKMVKIRRVAKVVKGGRRFGFAVIVVAGDEQGRAGFGSGKAKEVPEAIRKATENAKRRLIRVPLREGRTLHHDIKGRHGSTQVILRSAPPGTGIIAGGPVRAVLERLGVQDAVGKSIGSGNAINMVRATFDALSQVQAPRDVASRRGCKVSDVIGHTSAAKGKAQTRKPEEDGVEGATSDSTPPEQKPAAKAELASPDETPADVADGKDTKQAEA